MRADNQHERLAVETPEEREKEDYSECPQYCPETDRAGDHLTVYK